MSEASVRASQWVGAETEPATAVLIAAGDLRETIVEALEGQALVVASFDRVEDLAGRDGCEDPSVIVLCIEDTIASRARIIEPLARRFARTPIVVVCSSIDRWEIGRASCRERV